MTTFQVGKHLERNDAGSASRRAAFGPRARILRAWPLSRLVSMDKETNGVPWLLCGRRTQHGMDQMQKE